MARVRPAAGEPPAGAALRARHLGPRGGGAAARGLRPLARSVDRGLVSDARIVLFGATGYTGGLAARALVADGARPVLAGRDRGRLEALAEELGGLETAVANVAD